MKTDVFFISQIAYKNHLEQVPQKTMLQQFDEIGNMIRKIIAQSKMVN